MYGHGIGRFQLVVCLCHPNDVQFCWEAVHLLLEGDMCQAGGIDVDGLRPGGLRFVAEGWLEVRVEVMPVGDCIWRVQVS